MLDQRARPQHPRLRGLRLLLGLIDSAVGLPFANQVGCALRKLERQRLELTAVALVARASGIGGPLERAAHLVQERREQGLVRRLRAELASDAFGLGSGPFLGVHRRAGQPNRKQRSAERADWPTLAVSPVREAEVEIEGGGRLRGPRRFHAETKPRKGPRVKALVSAPGPGYRRRMAERKRASWDEYFMAIAREVATRSTCDRKHVGALIVREKIILTTGYNGSIRGLSHCDDEGHLMEDGHCVRTVHAEANAIVQAARNGVRLEGGDIYVTASPCFGCFKLIANAGLRRIVFGEFYRDKRIYDLSAQLNIQLDHLKIEELPA